MCANVDKSRKEVLQINLPEDSENLVNLRVTREQWVASHDHLGHDTAHRPHVDGS